MDPSTLDEAEEAGGVDAERLLAEASGTAPADEAVPEILEEVRSALELDETFAFDEDSVRSSVEELLVALVALRSADRNGSQLLDDLHEEFDAPLSPGTVYPALHDLTDEGVLEQRELIQTKEYVVDDESAARRRVADLASQHVALGMLFRAVLDSEDEES